MWDSKRCDQHDIAHMIINGQSICPRCQLDAENERFEKQVQQEIEESQQRIKYNVLGSRSLVQDESIRQATFDSFIDSGGEERSNKQRALQFVESYQRGEQFNLWIQSQITGVGKSHLAMSILKALNSLEVSCLFIDIDEMLRKIRASFDNPDSIYTEAYFIDLCTKVDFLVLDDLGAETGDIDTKKRASDYTSKILRAIMNGRQMKSTIITTNLTSHRLNEIYDRKVISRMMTNLQTITFKTANDKRIERLNF